MYFLSEDERRYLLRRLLPEARAIQVHPTLRGWHWADIDAPARSTYAAPLGVAEVAGGYCRSGRDAYIRRVLGQPGQTSRDMQAGAALHACAAAWVAAAKRVLYSTPPAVVLEALPRLLADGPDALLPIVSTVDEDTRLKMAALRRFETYRLLAATQEALARQPDIGPDALVGQVLPVIVEQRLDGQFLGLSRHVAVDALLVHGPMVLDLKFGPPEEFHRLSTTGYALVLESVHEMPVDIGCVVYVTFRGDTLAIERDFHFIGDELRSRFLEERDRKQRLVEEEIDPGLPERCHPRCAFLPFCGAEAQHRAGGKPPAARSPRLVSANRAAGAAPSAAPEHYLPPEAPASGA